MQGLGFVSLSQMRQRPPFFTMLAENKLQQSLFSIWLSPDPDVLEAGELVLGGTNPNRYSGSITYLDVSSATYVPADSSIAGRPSAFVVSDSDSTQAPVMLLT